MELDTPTLLQTIGRAQVYFVPCVEDARPEECFDDEPEYFERLRKRLERFEAVWFTAKVYVELDGTEIGSSYLGGCLYGRYEDFIKESDIVADMQSDAIAEAIEFLERTEDTLEALKNVKKSLDA